MALQADRQRQTADAYRAPYALRSRIEDTIALASDRLSMRRGRYRGEAETHLQNLTTAYANKLMRCVDWVDRMPGPASRSSHFLAPNTSVNEFANNIKPLMDSV